MILAVYRKELWSCVSFLSIRGIAAAEGPGIPRYHTILYESIDEILCIFPIKTF